MIVENGSVKDQVSKRVPQIGILFIFPPEILRIDRQIRAPQMGLEPQDSVSKIGIILGEFVGHAV